MKPASTLLLLSLMAASAFAAEPRTAGQSAPAAPLMWIAFPDSRLEMRGLPWFAENTPELWRLPKSAKNRVPSRVWGRAVAPDGGRIRFSSTTTRLALRVEIVGPPKKRANFDAYIGDAFAGSAGSVGPRSADLVLFAGQKPRGETITIYLPNTSEVRVLAVGIDSDAIIGRPAPFSLEAPLVCYGSSVLQGTGSAHPSRTYPAVLARRLNLDFVNLGFGGSGKAEPEVVALVNLPKACGFLFDLGKSYGAQTKEPFARMFADIRSAHPSVPIFCVTPIYSTKEVTVEGYREKSENLRDLMRGVAVERRDAGDRNIHIVEGLELFGPADEALFNDPLHPNDAGNERMGDRLLPLVKSAVMGRN